MDGQISSHEPAAALLSRARALAALGEDEAAKQCYLQLLGAAPRHCAALLELGALAQASGHISAARTAFGQAVACHPNNAVARVSLARLLREEGQLEAARNHYVAALYAQPGMPAAHQGLAAVYDALGIGVPARSHRQLGFTGNAVVRSPFRGVGPAARVLLLVSAQGGNIPVQGWIDDRRFAVTAVYTEFHDPAEPLPAHELVVNAIGDAELCGTALNAAEALLAGNQAPVVNLPGRVQATGRMANARRLGALPWVIAPGIQTLRRHEIPAALKFPLLLRVPGYHTGQHLVRVEAPAALTGAMAKLPGEEFLAIEYLDARGPDGMARKYRVMFVDGVAYPLHLAVSEHWKVHYFTAAMAENAAFRAEEQQFLEDMPAVLGARAMAALGAIQAALGLDYAGIDFGLAPDGRLLLFEANATMAIVPPNDDPIWDYRRPAINQVLGARAEMLQRRIKAMAEGPFQNALR